MSSGINLLQEVVYDENGAPRITHQVNGTTISIGPFLDGLKKSDTNDLEVIVVGKKRDINFIINDEKMGYHIDPIEPEFLVAEMETLILRVEDLQQQQKPITEETLFAPELQRLRANKEQGDHKPFGDLVSGQLK